MLNEWDEFFMDLAQKIGSRSKDPSTKTGAAIVSPDRTDIILGYNGFARRMKDTAELYADREKKYSRIIHAETNAIVLAKRPVDGYTLYVHPLLPCDRCAVLIVQVGIIRVVAPKPTGELAARWKASHDLSRSYLNEAGVEILEYNTQDETKGI